MRGNSIKWIIFICVVVSLIIVIGYSYQHQMSEEYSKRDIDQEEEAEWIPLKMFIIGQLPLDFDRVLLKANDILRKQIGVNLTVEFIDQKNVASDYHTIFAGGADFDLIQVYPYHYNLYASRSAYMNLTDDMLKKCTPTSYKELNGTLLQDVRMGEMLYMLPSDAFLESQQVMLIRGDILENMGFKEIYSIENLEGYFLEVKKQNADMIPLDIGYNGFDLMTFLYLQPNGLEIYDKFLHMTSISNDEKEMTWLPEDSDFITYYELIKRWRDQGFIPENASSKKIVTGANFESGQTAAYIGNIYEIENLQRKVAKDNPNYDPIIITLGNTINQARYPLDHGIAIKNGSQYAAKSLMFIEELRTNEDLFRLLNYGIKGIHYTISDEGNYVPLSGSIRYPIYNNFVWCMSNEYKIPYQFTIQSYNEVTFIPTNKHHAVSMKLDYLDLSDIEAMNINALYPLTLGFESNENNAITDYIELMENTQFRNYQSAVIETIQSSNGR